MEYATLARWIMILLIWIMPENYASLYLHWEVILLLLDGLISDPLYYTIVKHFKFVSTSWYNVVYYYAHLLLKNI